MYIIGLIPARGGSKGIPNKNLSNLCGKQLIEYTFNAAKESKCLNRIILSTDDENIANVGRTSGIEVPFLRPKFLAEDNSSMIDVTLHLLDFLKNEENLIPDFIMILQPTSPLRNQKHIIEAYQILNDHQDIDTLVSVCQVPHNFNPESIYCLKDGRLLNYHNTQNKVYDRHKKEVLYARNGPTILITRTKVILESHTFYGEKIYPYFMKREESIDIDEPFDLRIANMILNENLEKNDF